MLDYAGALIRLIGVIHERQQHKYAYRNVFLSVFENTYEGAKV